MSSISIHVNLLLIPFLVLLSALIGFAYRSSQIKSLKLKVIALENEMLQNHAEILSLQKEISKMPDTTFSSKTPVVNIKDNNISEDKIIPKHKSN